MEAGTHHSRNRFFQPPASPARPPGRASLPGPTAGAGQPPAFAFTLIELVFVMAILGILLVASAPRFAQITERLRVERSAFELTQLLRYAHERAVSESREIVWVWDQGAHRARLEMTEDGSTQPIRERMAMSARLPGEISVALLRDGASVDRVSFLPDGTSQPTTLQVSHDKDLYTATIDETTSQVLLSTGSTPH